MEWVRAHRGDTVARLLADRHYSRQSPGNRQFAPPGRVVILTTRAGDAYWVSLWQQYVDHAWKQAWNCTAFRNEGPIRSSDLVRQAVAATRAMFGDPPPGGMITFVDEGKIRHKRDPGRCFRKAGFDVAGRTGSGKLVLHLPAARIGPPEFPLEAQFALEL